MSIHDAARQAAEAIYDAAIAAARDNGYAAGKADGRVQGAADRDPEVAQLRTELAGIQAAYDAHMATHQPAPEPEPVWTGPLVGAHYATEKTAARGLRDMPVHRTFANHLPVTFDRHEASEDLGKRVSWLSVKTGVAATARGERDAPIRAFVRSIPAGHPVMMTVEHEPENPSKANKPAEFVACQKRVYELIKAERPETLVGPIYMAGLFGGYPAPRTYAHWGVPKGSLDFLGIDVYQPYMMPVFGTRSAWPAFPPATTAAALAKAKELGVPLAIGEFGAGEHADGPAKKIEWIRSVIEWGKANGLLAVCYFDSFKPGDTSESIVLDSTPAFRDAWNGLVAASPTGLPKRK